MTPNPQDSAVALEVERAAFEAWFRKEYHDRLCRNMPDKSYNDPTAHATWGSWQARASQSDGTSGDDAAVRVAAIEEVVSIFEYWLGDEPTDSYQARCLAAIRALAAPNQGENHVG